MRRAIGAGVNAVFFGLKRAYYATLGLSRRTLRKMGLTAARFDLLYALYRAGRWSLLQSELWRTLGVCPSVVSRMLKSLEELGYVMRTRPRGDARQREVTLTKTGRARILRGMRQFIGWGFASLALDSALEPEHWYDEWRGWGAVSLLDGALSRIRKGFGDTAYLPYPWGPDP